MSYLIEAMPHTGTGSDMVCYVKEDGGFQVLTINGTISKGKTRRSLGRFSYKVLRKTSLI